MTIRTLWLLPTRLVGIGCVSERYKIIKHLTIFCHNAHLADVFCQLWDKFEWMLLTSLLSYGTTTLDLVNCWVNLPLDASNFSFVIWHHVLTLDLVSCWILLTSSVNLKTSSSGCFWLLLSYGTTTPDLVSCWVNLTLDASYFSFVIWHQVLTLDLVSCWILLTSSVSLETSSSGCFWLLFFYMAPRLLTWSVVGWTSDFSLSYGTIYCHMAPFWFLTWSVVG